MKKPLINIRWLFIAVVFFLLIVAVVLMWDSAEWWLGTSLIGIAILALLGYYVFIPHAYRIDERGLTLYYGFGLHAWAEWEEIKSISVWHDHVFPWREQYRIGYFQSRLPIHHEGEIPKTKKTARLIQLYWHGNFD